MKKFIHNENPGRSKNMRFWGSETIPGQEISPGMTRRASASKSNILGRRQTRWVLARHQKHEIRKNHQILIGFSFVSHILYNRINWSEVETCTLKYAWPHIPSSGQLNFQTLSNSTFKVTKMTIFMKKLMKFLTSCKNSSRIDLEPSPRMKNSRGTRI